MNDKICIYTCITGGYDNLSDIENPDPNIDYICFTNNQNLTSSTWKIIQIDSDGLDNHRLARRIKILGHPYIFKHYSISIWSDASVVWDTRPSDFTKKFLGNHLLATFKHSARTTVHDEAIACLTCNKDTKQNLLHTLSFLEKENFPDQNGLLETTVLIRRHNDPAVHKAMELWNKVNQAYSKRDQLTLPYVIWKTNLDFSAIPLNVWDNTYFHCNRHLDRDNFDICNVYYGDPDIDFDFSKHFTYNFKHHTHNTYTITTTIPVTTKEITLNPTNRIGVSFGNIKISPIPTHQTIFNSFSYHNSRNVFCTSHNIIKISGNFTKGQPFSFSITMAPLDATDIQQLIEILWSTQATAVHQCNLLSEKYQHTKHTLQATEQQLHQLQNCRVIKLSNKLHQLFPKSH